MRKLENGTNPEISGLLSMLFFEEKFELQFRVNILVLVLIVSVFILKNQPLRSFHVFFSVCLEYIKMK